MAFIYRNALAPAVATWNSHNAIFHKFDKAFDKGLIDGVPVYGWCHYYQAKVWVESPILKRFLKAIGINWAEFRTQEIDKEINDLRFYLKDTYNWDGSTAGEPYWDYPSTAESTLIVPPTKQQIVDTFNSTFSVGDEITVTVQYGGPTKRYLDEHKLTLTINPDTQIIVNAELNKDAIRTVLESNPWYYMANSRHLPYEYNSTPFQLYTQVS